MNGRRLVRLSAGLGAAAGSAVVVSAWPVTDFLRWLPDLLVGWAFLLSGVMVSERGSRRQGLLIGAVGVAWFVPDLGLGAALLYAAVLLHMSLAMPRGRLGTARRRAICGVAYLAVPFLDGRDIELATLGLSVLLLGVAAVSSGSRRTVSALVGALFVVNAVAHLVAPREGDLVLLLGYEVCLLVLAALLPVVHMGSSRGSDLTDLVVQLGPEDALADLGRRDPGVLAEPAFRSAWATAANIRSANAELSGRLARQLEELAKSRARLVAAEDLERARLEERLHHGPLGRLDHIAAGLSVLAGSSSPAKVHLDRAAEHLRLGQADLTRIARGLHPMAVADGHLESALRDLAARSPVPIELRLGVVRSAPGLAATIFYVCNEAVANALKHSSARQITVVVERLDDVSTSIRVEVVDDGDGGAQPERGTGLAGLAERVRAMGGAFQVGDNEPHGTKVSAVLPEVEPPLTADA